jgi:hypothetical protein
MSNAIDIASRRAGLKSNELQEESRLHWRIERTQKVISFLTGRIMRADRKYPNLINEPNTKAYKKYYQLQRRKKKVYGHLHFLLDIQTGIHSQPENLKLAI